MPVECEYRPVRIVARLGQQIGFTTKASGKLAPRSTSSRCTVGMAQSVSKRWSSVTTRTIVGGSAGSAAAGGATETIAPRTSPGIAPSAHARRVRTAHAPRYLASAADISRTTEERRGRPARFASSSGSRRRS